MKIIHVICEGQTEANFVKKVLLQQFGGAHYTLRPSRRAQGTGDEYIWNGEAGRVHT